MANAGQGDIINGACPSSSRGDGSGREIVTYEMATVKRLKKIGQTGVHENCL